MIFLSIVSGFGERKIYKLSLVSIAFFVIGISSYLTLKDAHRYESTVDIQSIAFLNEKLNNCNCVLLPSERGRRGFEMVGRLRYVDRVGDHVMGSIFTPPVLDQWNLASWNRNSDAMRVFIIVRKDYLPKGHIVPMPIIADSKSYSIYDSGVSLGELKLANASGLSNWINMKIYGRAL